MAERNITIEANPVPDKLDEKRLYKSFTYGLRVLTGVANKRHLLIQESCGDAA